MMTMMKNGQVWDACGTIAEAVNLTTNATDTQPGDVVEVWHWHKVVATIDVHERGVAAPRVEDASRTATQAEVAKCRADVLAAAKQACNHPPTRHYSWFARDDREPSGQVLCVGCCACGAVLCGGV